MLSHLKNDWYNLPHQPYKKIVFFNCKCSRKHPHLAADKTSLLPMSKNLGLRGGWYQPIRTQFLLAITNQGAGKCMLSQLWWLSANISDKCNFYSVIMFSYPELRSELETVFFRMFRNICGIKGWKKAKQLIDLILSSPHFRDAITFKKH